MSKSLDQEQALVSHTHDAQMRKPSNGLVVFVVFLVFMSWVLAQPLFAHAQSNGLHTAEPVSPQKSSSTLSSEAALSEALDSLTQRFNEMERNQQALEEQAHQAESGQKNAEETLRVLRDHMDHTFNKIELIATFIGGCITGVLLMLLFRQKTPARRPVTPRTSSGTKPVSTSTAPTATSGLPRTSLSSSRSSPPSPLPHQTPHQQTPLPAKVQIAPETTADASLAGTDPVIELANVMTSLGLAPEAARDLMTYIYQQHSKDPLHWFKLLEIYHDMGHREAFDKSASDLTHTLNIAPLQWECTPDAQYLNSLEDYPHLIAKLQSLWHKPECNAFLHQLLEDNRQGHRSGFSKPVVEDIVLLSNLLKSRPAKNADGIVRL